MATFAEQLFEEGKLEGKLEGIEGTLEAMNLIDGGWHNKAITEKTGLSFDVIEKLREKLEHWDYIKK